MTLRPARDEIIIDQGADFYWARALVHRNGTLRNTAGYTASFKVWPNGDYSQPPVVTLTTQNGGIEVGVQGIQKATTTINAVAQEGDTMISVASATNIIIGQTVAVFLDSGAVFTPVITGLVGTTVTMSQGLPETIGTVSLNVVKTFDPNRMLYNLCLLMVAADTAALEPWGVGVYRVDLVDPVGHVQRLAAWTCCLEQGE